MQKHIIMLLSGAEAVKQILPQYGEVPQGDESDIEEAEIVLDRMIEEYHPSFDHVTLEFYREVTRNHLADPRLKNIVVDLANTLRDRTSMTRDEVVAFVEEKAKEHLGCFLKTIIET